MTYLLFTEKLASCNWSPFSPVYLEHWEPDDHGGKRCVRILATDIRFDMANGNVIISGPTPDFHGKP